jgi:hypothetical protein
LAGTKFVGAGAALKNFGKYFNIGFAILMVQSLANTN